MFQLFFTDETFINYETATREDLVRWINDAPTSANRQLRKQFCYAKMYNADFSALLKRFNLKVQNESIKPKSKD